MNKRTYLVDFSYTSNLNRYRDQTIVECIPVDIYGELTKCIRDYKGENDEIKCLHIDSVILLD